MNKRIRLPNFFIAGVPKAGTSSLHNWLAAHPMTLSSKDKETCFFADLDSHIYRPDFNSQAGLSQYSQQFDGKTAQEPAVIFESTPAYIYQRNALKMIPKLSTNPKCLFVLREPAAQIKSVFSYYQNNWGHIPADLRFADYLKAAHSGSLSCAGNELAEHPFKFARYVDFLKPWRHALGPKRLKIITFEDLVRAPKSSTADIARWLELPTDFYDDFDFAAENESYQPRSRLLQKINIAVRARLPKGVLYDSVRSGYRKLNTTKPQKADDLEIAYAMIRADLAGSNAELSSAFDLDLSHWPAN